MSGLVGINNIVTLTGYGSNICALQILTSFISGMPGLLKVGIYLLGLPEGEGKQ